MLLPLHSMIPSGEGTRISGSNTAVRRLLHRIGSTRPAPAKRMSICTLRPSVQPNCSRRARKSQGATVLPDRLRRSSSAPRYAEPGRAAAPARPPATPSRSPAIPINSRRLTRTPFYDDETTLSDDLGQGSGDWCVAIASSEAGSMAADLAHLPARNPCPLSLDFGHGGGRPGHLPFSDITGPEQAQQFDGHDTRNPMK